MVTNLKLVPLFVLVFVHHLEGWTIKLLSGYRY